MGVSGASGTTILIGTTASNPATDTYTLMGSVNSIGKFGISFGEIKFEDLGLGETFKFKGARDDGTIALGLGMDRADAGQIALLAALLVKDDYNFKVIYNDSLPAVTAAVTISLATPGVVTWTAHGLAVGTPVKFTTTGALLTGLTAGTTYYVKTVLSVDTFSVAATAGGAAIATSGTQSGTHTGTTVPAASYDTFAAKVLAYETTPGSLSGTVAAAVNLGIKSGSLVMVAHVP